MTRFRAPVFARRQLEYARDIRPMTETVWFPARGGAQMERGKQQAQGRHDGQPCGDRAHLTARPADRMDSVADRLEQELPLRRWPAQAEGGKRGKCNENYYQMQMRGNKIC